MGVSPVHHRRNGKSMRLRIHRFFCNIKLLKRQIDRSAPPNYSRIARLKTFGEFIDLHIDDMCDVGKAPLRSKPATFELLKRQLASANMTSLGCEQLSRRVVRSHQQGVRLCKTLGGTPQT